MSQHRSDSQSPKTAIHNNPLGPIATTYDFLHGVSDLQKAYLTDVELNPSVLLIRTMLQGIELVYYNLTELSNRQLVARQQFGESASEPRRYTYVTWHASLLSIAVRLANEAISARKSFAPPADHRDYMSPACVEYDAAFELLSAVELADLRKSRNRHAAAVVSGGLSNSLAMLMHRLGETLHLRSLLASRLKELADVEREQALEDFIGSAHLRSAYSSPSLKSEYDTYYSQFRLLHQIPELLALYCVSAIDRLRATGFADRTALMLSLIRISSLLRLTVECLAPLVQLMIPMEYYKIRENLGATSGSHSENIARRLVTKDIAELRRAIKALPESQDSEPIQLLFADIECTVLLWRDLHLALPRGVLGGHGTVSLMGHADGYAAAANMRDAYAHANSHAPIVVPQPRTGVPAKASTDLDITIRALYAEHAKTRFANVQDRSGFFKSYPKRGI